MTDTPSHGVPSPDVVSLRHTLSVHDVERELVAAGVPRSYRQIVRYCETGMLDAVKVPGPTGAQWFITQDSLPKAIGDLKQWEVQRASRGTPGPAMSDRVDAPNVQESGAAIASQSAPKPAVSTPQTAAKASETDPVAAGYVTQLEKRIDEKDDVILLLKGQLVSKDEQIKELSTRYRETHTLLGAMQRMLAPLLGQGDPFKTGQQGREGDSPSDTPPTA